MPASTWLLSLPYDCARHRLSPGSPMLAARSCHTVGTSLPYVWAFQLMGL
jgi:hypothetical protein